MADRNMVTAEEVRHMAKLSRLKVTSGEEELFCSQFASILGHMAILASVDTDGVEPLYSPEEGHASTRADVAANIRVREQILANAPETNGETFVLPRIV